MRIQSALNFLSIILLIISLISLLVLLCCLKINLDILPFLSVLVLSMFLSSAIYFANRNIEAKFDIRSITYSIFLAWPLLIIMGAIPLLFIFPNLDLFDVLFISSSLSTTTGAWLSNSLVIPKEYFIWQSALQWLGGILTLIIATSFIEVLFEKTSSDSNSFDLSKIKIIFLIYSVLTLILVGIFYWLNLSLQDSFRLSISLLSTSSSFSSVDSSSFTPYNSKILLVMIFGMLLGSLSVTLHYKAFISGIGSYIKDKNVKSLILLTIIIYIIIYLFSDSHSYLYSYDYIVKKFFIIFSLLTTTGFIPIIDYEGQFSPTIMFLILLTFIGGTTSSTTGGIKISRLLYLFQHISVELYHLLHPREILSRDGDLNKKNTSLIFVSVILFFSLIFVFFIIFSLLGFDFRSSLVIVISFITNTGQGILTLNGISFFPSSALESIVSIFAMIIGRIETIFIMLFFTKTFWLE